MYALRHSTAHLLAAALKNIWPNIVFGIGPVIENGFYYDVYFDDDTKITEDDFSRIESEMNKLVKADLAYEQYFLSLKDAEKWAETTNQRFKLELIKDLKNFGTTEFKKLTSSEIETFAETDFNLERISFYRCGDFEDLCRGPHVRKTSEITAFKLTKVSGAYWRGDINNPQMQRIYGVSFSNKSDLQNYLKMIEESKLRDHRKLGVELDLFVFSDLVGSGLPLFTPRGTVLREEVSKLSNDLRLRNNYQKVSIPHITKKDLYETSGHWAKFGEELFLVKSQETSDQLVLKPMNCPHHTQIFDSKPRSYKDLPLRYLETTTVYRDEKSGELGGLNRVRSITQDDSHVFCRQDAIDQEIDFLLSCAKKLYDTVDMKLRIRLSYRDESDNYLGSKELWDVSQKQLKQAVVNNSLDFIEQDGEAAFYGPKIDFMATDALGREHQVATIQLDFVQPERFNLKFTNEKGESERPVMIHSALLGSIERFLSVYIEHTAGKFPVWSAPEQIRIMTINQEKETLDFANSLMSQAFDLGLRVSADFDSESVSKKIRKSQMLKIPYSIVIGDKEITSGKVQPRIREDLKNDNQKDILLPAEDFLKAVKTEAEQRLKLTSL